MLRYAADRRTLVYGLIITVLALVQWFLPAIYWPLVLASCVMAVPVAVIAHNHNHLGIFKSQRLNRLTDYWITVFYGFPAFGWIPTHNQNHHKLNNKAGDYTVTWRFSEKNNLLTLVTYPTISSMYQQPPIRQFLRERWKKNRRQGMFYASQFLLLLVVLVVAFWVDWQRALLLVVLPQQVSLFAVLTFNYVQHVHADEESPTNHSRNFVGGFLNAYLFNNGFHTVHHDTPGLHWSLTPAAHAKIAHTIDPSLIETSFWGYILRVYVLGMFSPRYQTRSMRLARLGDQHQSQ